MRLRDATLSALVVLGPLAGCEIIDQIQGVATLMEQAGEHLEEDLKAPLTNDEIDMFVRVAPELKKFSEEASVKWKPDPNANDFSQMSTGLGALGDYVAFFESQDTRLTEFYVVTIKIYDAYALIGFDEGQAEARKRLEDERKELEAKKSAATGDDVKKLEIELVRNEKALANLDEIKKAREKKPEGQKPYTLTPEEIDLVRNRRDEIKAALEETGYETPKED
jgi:hypothetical protein